MPIQTQEKTFEHMRYIMSTEFGSVRPSRLMLRKMRERAELLHEIEPAYKRAMNFETVLALVVAVAIALTIRFYGFELIRVEGPSMEPTLYTNERVFVEKLTYAFKEPQRGDIIVCNYDTNVYDKPVIKRIVALAGETIEIVDGHYVVDGVLIDESPYWNNLMLEDMPPIKVPPRHVFVSGDNRDVSLDSRIVGAIPYEKVRGKAQFFVWPLSRFGEMINPDLLIQ